MPKCLRRSPFFLFLLCFVIVFVVCLFVCLNLYVCNCLFVVVVVVVVGAVVVVVVVVVAFNKCCLVSFSFLLIRLNYVLVHHLHGLSNLSLLGTADLYGSFWNHSC